ncbi:MAG: tRNA pseudouridine(55) synthase TruB [Clostridia bacterium]|nr:tRNA pseudouridine(55) synthase TruB [Clostridia bacterium]
MTGFIFLDKPEGITSFTAVNKTRRILGIKKAGHTGTLDPMATGVLPIMLGGATRFSQYLPTHDKSYRARILLGTVTDTLDTTGEVLETREVNVASEELHSAVMSFVGDIKQLPPMYSAVSKNGVRLYKLARQGIEIEREARDVTIHSIEIITELENNEFEIDVSCSAGTYIRSLAADIGEKLGCGAVISALRRTKANGISIDKTVTFEELEKAVEAGMVENLIAPCDEMLSAYPSVRVSEKQAVYFSNGGALDLNRVKDKTTVGLCLVYSPSGKLMGLGNIDREAGELKVERILVYQQK